MHENLVMPAYISSARHYAAIHVQNKQAIFHGNTAKSTVNKR